MFEPSTGSWSSTAPGVMKSLGGDTERTARLNVRVMETLFALVGLVVGADLRIRSSLPMKRSLRWASKRRSARGPSSSALSGSKPSGIEHVAERATKVRNPGFVLDVAATRGLSVGRQFGGGSWGRWAVERTFGPIARSRWVSVVGSSTDLFVTRS